MFAIGGEYGDIGSDQGLRGYRRSIVASMLATGGVMARMARMARMASMRDPYRPEREERRRSIYI